MYALAKFLSLVPRKSRPHLAKIDRDAHQVAGSPPPKDLCFAALLQGDLMQEQCATERFVGRQSLAFSEQILRIREGQRSPTRKLREMWIFGVVRHAVH
jgi:hypothetical protein